MACGVFDSSTLAVSMLWLSVPACRRLAAWHAAADQGWLQPCALCQACLATSQHMIMHATHRWTANGPIWEMRSTSSSRMFVSLTLLQHLMLSKSSHHFSQQGACCWSFIASSRHVRHPTDPQCMNACMLSAPLQPALHVRHLSLTASPCACRVPGDAPPATCCCGYHHHPSLCCNSSVPGELAAQGPACSPALAGIVLISSASGSIVQTQHKA
jgi:hypothetical protein